MHIKDSKIKHILIASLLALSFSSCTLFDKDLEQDRHIASFRREILVTLDSLEQPKDRIASLENILKRIDADIALITPRKKNELVKNCYSFISNEHTIVENYKEALIYAEKFIKLDENDARGYFIRGVSFQGSAQDSLALVDYKKAIQLNEKYTPAYYNAAIVFTGTQDYDQALSYYTQAMKYKPSNLKDIYVNRGNIYEAMNSYSLALQDYDSAIELDSLDATAYSNRASIYTNQEQYEKAIADYTKSIELDSMMADTYNKRANAYDLLNVQDKALADYKKAALLASRNEDEQKKISEEGIISIQKENRSKAKRKK